MKLLVLVMIILLSSCTEFRVLTGLGVHSNKIDEPYWENENPIGFIRGEANYNFDDNLFMGGQISHESSIFFDDGKGFNYIGIQAGYKWDIN